MPAGKPEQVPKKKSPFINHPQRFPKATAAAALLVNDLHQMTKKGPRTMVATVVDTSFHTTQGYVLATTELGIVPVYGVPIGTVVPQMRILARQQGGQSTARAFVFDSYAPTTSSQNSTGSVLYTSPIHQNAIMATTTNTLATPSGLVGPAGYYWHAFLYLPQLPPAGSYYTLFSMNSNAPASAVCLDLLPSGLLRFWSIADGHGYITNTPVPPHAIHWVQIVSGLGAGLEFTVDGINTYTGLLSSTDAPTFAGNGATYTLTALTDSAGNNPCPLGAWISRLGFGSSFNGTNVVALPNGTSVPTSDEEIPVFNVSVTQMTEALYLCNDTPGSSICANSAPAGSASAIALTAPYLTVSALGPY
jgi:hypothetical protein